MFADPLEATLAQLVAAVRTKALSPSELLEAHIARIKAVNPALNAVVEERFVPARGEAAGAEKTLHAARSTDELPALLGIPCTIKEFIAVEGMRQTGGLLAERDHVALNDATVVARLRAAGAIVMATTNVPEGGMWMETHNLIYGRTNNPWNLRHTPGGSSGGEAALVAAGATPFGLGSDVGGSVRIPAAFCGVAAHKPSGRLVPNTGHWGPVNHGTGPFLTCGPITRSAHDLAALLDIVAGPDGRDKHTEAWALGDAAEVDFGDCTVFSIDDLGVRYSKGMLGARERAIEVLVSAGGQRRELDIPGLNRAMAVWTLAMDEAADGGRDDSFAAVLGSGRPISLARELGRAAVGRGRFTLPALAFAAMEKVASNLPAAVTRGVPRARVLAEEINKRLSGRGVIIHPTYSRAAPRHHAALLTPFDAMSTALWNVLELPATHVPTGFAANGLPLGVQVIAARGNDHLAIALACAIEDRLGRLGLAPAL